MILVSKNAFRRKLIRKNAISATNAAVNSKQDYRGRLKESREIALQTCQKLLNVCNCACLLFETLEEKGNVAVEAWDLPRSHSTPDNSQRGLFTNTTMLRGFTRYD